MANKDAFYEAILSAGAGTQKTASEHDIIAALEGTDLSEDELNKLASELEAALGDLDDVDDVDDVDEVDEVDEIDEADGEETEDADKSAAEEDDADVVTDAETEDVAEEETEAEEVDDEAGEDTDDEVDTEVDSEEEIEDDEDLESLAAAYEAEYEKYASEGRTVKDYIFDQVEDEEFASVVGDMAEKLAFVSELPVFMVADDLMTTISEKISAGENQNA